MADDLDPVYKIPLKTEYEKISFELRSLLGDERVLGTASFTYDFIKLAEPEKEYMHLVYLSPMGGNDLSVKDWGIDAHDYPRMEIGIEVDKHGDLPVVASTTSKQFVDHYRDESNYVARTSRIADDTRYMATVEPLETRTTLVRDKGYLSPTRKLYDTGIRVDGTQQTIYKREGRRARSTRHGSAGRSLGNETMEVRGSRPSKFARVRSSKSIKVTRDTPQHREQLKVVLKRLMSNLDHKHDDLIKDTENRLKILDWLFKNKAQYDSAYNGGGSDISEQQTLVSEVDKEYSEVYKLDQDDLFSLRQDVERLREELAQAERDLVLARETRERLLEFFGRSQDDLEIVEEEIIEDETGRQTSKRLINRYIRREDKEIQGIRDENQTVYKQLDNIRRQISMRLLSAQSQGIGVNFEDLFQGINMKLNGVMGGKEIQTQTLKELQEEYLRLVDNNLELKKKKIDTENEVHTLKDFIANDKEFKLTLEDSGTGSRALVSEKRDLERQYKANVDKIRQLEDTVGDQKGGQQIERMAKRLETNLKLRNDLHNDIMRSASSNVQTISLDAEAVGNPADDRKIEDLLDEIESKEKEINQLLELKEAADRKKRASKKKNELSYNLRQDINELERKVSEAYSERDRAAPDTGRDRNIDIELEKKEVKIQEHERTLEQLEREKARLEERLELGPGSQGAEPDEEVERTIEDLQARLNEMDKIINSSKRSKDFRRIQQKKKMLQEKEEYIAELQRQLG